MQHAQKKHWKLNAQKQKKSPKALENTGKIPMTSGFVEKLDLDHEI